MKNKFLKKLNVSLILSFMLFGMNLSAPSVFSAPVNTIGNTDPGTYVGDTAENLLNAVDSNISSVVLDTTNKLAYMGNSANPATIYKVNIDPQSTYYMQVTDRIETTADDQIGNLSSGIYYLDNTTPYAFFGAKAQGKIIRVGISNGSCTSPLVRSLSNDGTFCILDAVSTDSSLGSTVVKDPNTAYAYFGGANNQVFAVDLSHFSQGLKATIQTGTTQKNFVTSIVDGASGYAYFGASPNDSTNAPSVVQIKLSNDFNSTPPSETGSVTIGDSTTSLVSSVFNTVPEFGYFAYNQGTANKIDQINTNTNDFTNSGLIGNTLTMATSSNNFGSAAFFNSNNSTAYFSTAANIATVEFDGQTGAPSEVTGNDPRIIDSSLDGVTAMAFDGTDHVYVGSGNHNTLPGELFGYIDLAANPAPAEKTYVLNGPEVGTILGFDAPMQTLNSNDSNHYVFLTTISGGSNPSTSIVKMQTTSAGLERVKTLNFDGTQGKIVSAFRDGIYGYFAFDRSAISNTNVSYVLKVNLDTMAVVKSLSFDAIYGAVTGGVLDESAHMAYFTVGTTIQRVPTDASDATSNFDNFTGPTNTNDVLSIVGHSGIEIAVNSMALRTASTRKLYIGTKYNQGNPEANDIIEIDLPDSQTAFGTASANIENFLTVGSGQNQQTIAGNFDTAAYDDVNDKIYFASDESSSKLIQIDPTATFDSNIAANSAAVDTTFPNVASSKIDSNAGLLFLAYQSGNAIMSAVKLPSFAAGEPLSSTEITVKAQNTFFYPVVIDAASQNLYVDATAPDQQFHFVNPAYLEKVYYGANIPDTVHGYKATLTTQSNIKSFHFNSLYTGNTAYHVSIAFYDPSKNLIWSSPKMQVDNSHTGLIDINASAGTLAQGKTLSNLPAGDYWLAFATDAPKDVTGFIASTYGSGFALTMQNPYVGNNTPFPSTISGEKANNQTWAIYATTDSIPGLYNASNQLVFNTTSQSYNHYYNNGPSQLDWTQQGATFQLYNALDPVNHRLFSTGFNFTDSSITMYSLNQNNQLITSTNFPNSKKPVKFNTILDSDPAAVVPTGIAYDPGTERLFVSYSNAVNGTPQGTEIGKVQIFDASSTAINNLISGHSTSLPLLSSINSPDNSSAHGNYGNLATPFGLALDQDNQRLFVSDQSNNRVLAFDVSVHDTNACTDDDSGRSTDCALANGDNPDAVAVFGQADYSHVGPNRLPGTPSDSDIDAAIAANTLHKPTGLAYSSANKELYVADGHNYRVLAFNADPAHLAATNGQHVLYSLGENADAVFGQADFTHLDKSTIDDAHTSTTFSAAIDEKNNQLFVGDSDPNKRILVFNVDPAHLAATNDQHVSYSLGETADAILGVDNYGSAGNGKVTQTTFDQPAGLTFDQEQNQLFVNDPSNARTMIFRFIKNNKQLQAAGTVNEAYDDTIQSSDLSGMEANPGNPTFSITSGSLPTGLALCLGTLDTNNSQCNTPGELKGTPTTAGTYNFTVRVAVTLETSDNPSKTISFHDDVAYAISIIPAPTEHGSAGGGGGGGGLGMILIPTTPAAAGSMAPVSVPVNNGPVANCADPAYATSVVCRPQIPNGYPMPSNMPGPNNYYQLPADNSYTPDMQPDQSAQAAPAPAKRRKPTAAERASANAALAAKIAAKRAATAKANARLAAQIAAKRKATARANANLAARIAAQKRATAKANARLRAKSHRHK